MLCAQLDVLLRVGTVLMMVDTKDTGPMEENFSVNIIRF